MNRNLDVDSYQNIVQFGIYYHRRLDLDNEAFYGYLLKPWNWREERAAWLLAMNSPGIEPLSLEDLEK